MTTSDKVIEKGIGDHLRAEDDVVKNIVNENEKNELEIYSKYIC